MSANFTDNDLKGRIEAMGLTLETYKEDMPSTVYTQLKNYVDLLMAMLNDRASEQMKIKEFPLFRPSFNDGWRTDGY